MKDKKPWESPAYILESSWEKFYHFESQGNACSIYWNRLFSFKLERISGCVWFSYELTSLFKGRNCEGDGFLYREHRLARMGEIKVGLLLPDLLSSLWQQESLTREEKQRWWQRSDSLQLPKKFGLFLVWSRRTTTALVASETMICHLRKHRKIADPASCLEQVGKRCEVTKPEHLGRPWQRQLLKLWPLHNPS